MQAFIVVFCVEAEPWLWRPSVSWPQLAETFHSTSQLTAKLVSVLFSILVSKAYL